MYLGSASIVLAKVVLVRKMTTVPELHVTNLLQGLGAAVTEAIVQITVGDLFFVHHRGGMNACNITMVMIGCFIAPIAAGVQATRQSWRWSYYSLGITNAILLLFFVFFFEETKYVRLNEAPRESNTAPVVERQGRPMFAPQKPTSTESDDPSASQVMATTEKEKLAQLAPASGYVTSHTHTIDLSVPLKPLKERLALHTYSSESLLPCYYRPFIVLFSFPVVLCCAIQLGCGIMWYFIMLSVSSIVFSAPPYSFTPEMIGLLNLGP